MKKIVMMLLVLAVVASSAQAVIVTPLAKTVATGSDIVAPDVIPVPWAVGSVSAAPEWRDRTYASDPGKDPWSHVPGLIDECIYAQAGYAQAEIRTTITGLAPFATTDVYLLYTIGIDAATLGPKDNKDNYEVMARIDDGVTPMSAADHILGYADGTYTGYAMTDSYGNFPAGYDPEDGTPYFYGLYQAYLGVATADITGSASVLLDNAGDFGFSYDRFVYHGLSTEAIVNPNGPEVPEPATMLLLGLGGLLLRKRK